MSNATISIAYKIEGASGGFQKLTVDAEAFHKLMQANITEAEKFRKNLVDFAVISSGVKIVDQSFGDLINTLSNLTGESMNFEKAMKAVNTMAGKDSTGFEEMKDEVAELAKQLPIARDELANGLYQVISNGVPEGNWLEYLQASARSAVGGIADINQVVGVTSTVIKNYGLEWSEAADIQDKIQLTARNGVTSFEQLAQALPRVTGNAATLGVSIDELLGTFATLTGVSGNTAEVSTQLAAIFTALVKPSSEASKMAAQMGIQFDAASIKAAGGLQEFLRQLDKSIKIYAASNGVLEQEVYGKLFGSAESLRALIPLQGELADKFTSNVAAMVDSAGTMDAAYADMASTGEAVTQMLKNKYSAIMDVVAGATSAIQPYLNFTAALFTTGSNVITLVGALKTLNSAYLVHAASAVLLRARTLAVNAVIFATSLYSKKTALGLEMMRVAATGSERAMFGLQIAMRGLLMATGVGAAVMGVVWVMQKLTATSGKASESLEKLKEAEEEYIRAAGNAKTQIDKDIQSIDSLIKANKSSEETIKYLNETYGNLFGSHETLSEWYDILTRKSELYTKQLGYEAQATSLKTKLDEISERKKLAAEKKAELEKSGKDKHTATFQSMGSSLTHTYETKEHKELTKELEELTAEEAVLQKQLDAVNEKSAKNTKAIGGGPATPEKKVQISDMTWQQAKDAMDNAETELKNTNDSKKAKELTDRYKKLKARKEQLDRQYGFGSQGSTKKKTVVADPKTSEELSTNIEIYEKKLTNEDTEEQRIFREKIARWKKSKQAIEDSKKEAERPAELNSLEDFDAEISYQQKLLCSASKEEVAAIQKTINSLENQREAFVMPEELKSLKDYNKAIAYQQKLRDEADTKEEIAQHNELIRKYTEEADAMERAAHVRVSADKITSYKQLQEEISYCNQLLQEGTEEEKKYAEDSLPALTRKEKKMKVEQDSIGVTTDPAQARNLDEVSAAISLLDQKIQLAEGDEAQAYQRTKMAFEKKKEALERGIEIPTMMKEADEINRLTGREYKLKIRGMGFEELTSKISELRSMLKDMDHPVTENQRRDIESLIATYEKWRREGIDSFETFRNGWGSIKGIGDSVESLTQTLEGNGNTWQKLTGIVDGFLQIYDGIKTIVGIINMLSMATSTHTAAKTAEAAAIGVTAGAQTAEAVAAETNAMAQAPVIVANKAATASYMELAAAAYFAAHASIPFAGFGIASGFVAAATTMVEAIGVMPFADGGIVSGPTLGLVGEYAGAKNNPEVIAPLNRLRDLIGNDENGANGRVEFEIRGDRLYGLLRKYERNKNRT